jgi:hypothetical protein
MLPMWKKWTGCTSAERVGVSTTAGPHARTCLQMGCTEAPTHGHVVPVRCFVHKLSGMESFEDGPHVTLKEASRATPREAGAPGLGSCG